MLGLQHAELWSISYYTNFFFQNTTYSKHKRITKPPNHLIIKLKSYNIMKVIQREM